MQTLRSLVRIGQRLDEAWRQGRKLDSHNDYQWNNLTHSWTQLQSLRKRLQFARERGFSYCLPSLVEDYRWQLDDHSRLLQVLRGFQGPPIQDPSLADWVSELRALEEEFGKFIIDFKRLVLQVTTEPITLKGVDLGAFAIELVWTRLGEHRGSHSFEIVALDPHPATGREEVTHPHINDAELCAGDAAAPIDRALSEGRISEAFLLIRSVLTTYNARSAFVQLSEWDGFLCGDCGHRMDREASSTCQGCGSDLCDSCATSCRTCEETRCGGCLNACDGCRDLCCPGCLETVESDESLCAECRGRCSECSTLVARDDLNESELCRTCVEAQAAASPDPATQPEEPAHVA